jgi:hypothetical protein
MEHGAGDAISSPRLDVPNTAQPQQALLRRLHTNTPTTPHHSAGYYQHTSRYPLPVAGARRDKARCQQLNHNHCAGQSRMQLKFYGAVHCRTAAESLHQLHGVQRGPGGLLQQVCCAVAVSCCSSRFTSRTRNHDRRPTMQVCINLNAFARLRSTSYCSAASHTPGPARLPRKRARWKRGWKMVAGYA